MTGEFPFFLNMLPGQTPEEGQAILNFSHKAFAFSTYYLLLRKLNAMDPIYYLSQARQFASAFHNLAPSQELIGEMLKLADSFMEGFIDPQKFHKIKKMVAADCPSMTDVLKEMGRHKVMVPQNEKDSNPIAFASLTVCSSCITYLANMIEQSINENGLVVALPPAHRKMLKAFIADKHSLWPNLTDEPHP